MGNNDGITDALLWSLVRKFTKDGLNQPEDLMNEARAAAAFAVGKYKGKREASLRTFVYECVRRRLLYLDRQRKERIEPEFIEDLPEESYSSEANWHFRITMRQLLDDEEYETFTLRFVEDLTERQIADRMGTTRRRVRGCIARCIQKYELIEENHHKVSTQRRHSERWLEGSSD